MFCSQPCTMFFFHISLNLILADSLLGGYALCNFLVIFMIFKMSFRFPICQIMAQQSTGMCDKRAQKQALIHLQIIYFFDGLTISWRWSYFISEIFKHTLQHIPVCKADFLKNIPAMLHSYCPTFLIIQKFLKSGDPIKGGI